MTGRKSFRVIPDRRRGYIGEYGNLSDVVFLVIAADEQRLPVSQVEVKLEQIGVERGWGWGVETIATGVDPVSDGGVVRDVALCFVAQKIERGRVHTGSDSVRCKVSLVDLIRVQTTES